MRNSQQMHATAADYLQNLLLILTTSINVCTVEHLK